jgi:murein DD-endopeptidase MepM/ murein hydrolase activator NlpD
VPTIAPKLTKKGYVFPVYGPSSFVDTFGAGRADTGWHHGEDVFAALGAPVLAVADGTVFSVGWNNVGGNRVWLRDTKGNEFYYAHLSAFSPLAVDGAHVEAGDVLGFVGRSGDAERTPPHLHFEIHPVGLLALGYDGVINPYEYLLAWERLEDVRFVAGATWVPTLARIGNAPTPGAFLLSSTDISTAASLRARELARVLGQGPPREAT